MRPKLTRRGRVAARTLATAALAGSMLLALGAAGADESNAAPARDDRRATTALWSPRRTPGIFVDTVAQQRLTASLANAAGGYDACVAVDDHTAGNGVLARYRGDVALAPASTTKLLTALAALTVLGGEHRFTTAARRQGDTVYLVGGGDPVLTTPGYEARIRATARTATDVVTPLAELADAIAASGIVEIGTIVADDSRHETVRFLPGWRESYRDDVGALGALVVDDGFAGTTRVEDPALFAAQQLGSLLADRGIPVGATARGTAPTDAAEIARVESPPLADITASMLTSSDNLTAELLTRELGGDGTTASGTRRIVEAAGELGIPTAGVDVRDGSGLDPESRVTCDALLAVLQLGNAEIDRGLPVAGESGTLVNRFGGDPLAGLLRAKTGQINGVAGLAGVVDDSEGLRFSFLVNGEFSTSGGRALQVDAARAVAAYPDAPPAAEIVPAP